MKYLKMHIIKRLIYQITVVWRKASLAGFNQLPSFTGTVNVADVNLVCRSGTPWPLVGITSRRPSYLIASSKTRARLGGEGADFCVPR